MTTRALTSLPTTDTVWEVGMIHARLERDGAVAVGMLVVVERGSGAVRIASSVMEREGPAPVFRRALAAPNPPATPGRPKHVVFDDPTLRDRLLPILREAGLLSVATGATPALDDGIARLLQRHGAPIAPGIDHDVAAWRAALSTLVRVAPWRSVDMGVVFSFVGGGLDDFVATVCGKRGELRGVRLARAGAPDDATHLMLEEASGLSADEIERCLRGGLQFPPGLYPRVYAIFARKPSPASEDAQRRLLAAVRLVTTLCQAEPSLGAGAARSLELDGVRVSAARADAPTA